MFFRAADSNLQREGYLEFPGLIINGLLAELDHALVYDAFVIEGRHSAFLKVPRNEYPDTALLRRLNNEAGLFASMRSPALMELIETRNSPRGPLLVLSRGGGNLLENLIPALRGNLLRSTRLALSLSVMLQELHRSGLMHRSLNPRTIVINETAQTARLLDVLNATRASRMNRELERSVSMPANYPYMAPEQTGRVNRSVDHRSDLYSLGIILYQILAGTTPFRADNVSDWAYCHIALDIPPLPSNVPRFLQAVVMRLLAKNAEDRYQSTPGLTHDLKQCVHFLESGASGQEFTPGLQDGSEVLHLPEKIYGRTNELQLLTDALRMSAEGSFQVRFVQGSAGSGKTTLIGELKKLVSARGGVFAQGKFEQFERNVPYHAWIEVARELISRALQEKAENLTRLRSRLLDRPGANPAVIARLVPELSSLLGPQTEAEELPPQESRNRFVAAFLGFVTAFAEPGKPLVIFLDDFQWIDPGSAELVRGLFAAEHAEHIMLVLSSRDTAEDLGASALLEEIRQSSSFRSMRLGPLHPADIAVLTADTLRRTEDSVRVLAQRLHLLSGGNPLHVMQILQTLYAQGHIYFDQQSGQWCWDEQVGAGDAADLAGLLHDRIAKLSEAARLVLCAAACLNHSFDQALLAASLAAPDDLVSRGLTELLNEGLLVAFDGAEIVFEFPHDRIHQAALEACSQELRDQIHGRTARFLLAIGRQGRGPNPYLFALVDHLEAASTQIVSREERLEAARACLTATVRAEQNTAWSTVQHAAQTALRFLPPDAWQTEHELTWQIHRAAMNADYLNGNHERAEALFRSLSRATADPLRLARVYEQLVILYTNTGRHEESIDLALAGLARLGMKLPRNPGKLRVLLSLASVRLALGGRSPHEILHLTEMKDARLLAAMDLMMAVTPSAFFINQNLFAVVALRMTAMSLTHGNCRVSAYGYITYAILLLDALKDVKGGVRFARLAVTLGEKLDNAGLRAKIGVIFGAFINHWDAPMARSIVLLRNAYRHGLETGDLVYAGYALANRMFAAVVRGEPLDQIIKQCESFLKFTDRTKDTDVEGDFLLARQAALSLRGETASLHTFSNHEYSEEQHFRKMQKGNPVTLCFYYVLRMRSLYLASDYEQALSAAAALAKIIEPARPLVLGPAALFYEALALSASLRENSSSARHRRFQKILRQYRAWADFAPHFRYRVLILEAEDLARQGHPLAMSRYSEAVRAAGSQDDSLSRAIAAELAGRFCRQLGAVEAAHRYIGDAIYSYRNFGAFSKQKALEQEFPEASVPGVSSQGAGEMPSFIRSSIAISGEIVEARLLERVLQEIMIQAGARRAAYIQQTPSGPSVEAVGSVSPRLEILRDSSPLGKNPFPPASAVRHVLSTRETLVIADASREQDFGFGALNRPVRSVLCTPVSIQGRVLGAIYLENDLATDVFNQQRLDILSVLSAQFAVALENANLYGRMESLVRERTSELENSLQKLRELQTSQDLDYYLTSLLLQPLGGIRLTDPLVRVEQFASQKKKFTYLKWDEQLGGDISIARSVELQGNRMVAVANADAMGKSLQGAGGALVFGAVFEAFTSRPSSLEPEGWLRACYLELNRVFRSFSGYMMASSIIGLIDEASLTIYLLNADHPGSIILRRNRAMLLEEMPAARLGLGVAQADQIHIARFTAEPGDILILATDGRDDVMVPNQQGELSLNDDPEFILSVIQQARGNAETICRLLASGDRLTDDLSVLSVEFPAGAAKPAVSGSASAQA